MERPLNASLVSFFLFLSFFLSGCACVFFHSFFLSFRLSFFLSGCACGLNNLLDHSSFAVFNLSTRIARPEQTVQTQYNAVSDQSLHF